MKVLASKRNQRPIWSGRKKENYNVERMIAFLFISTQCLSNICCYIFPSCHYVIQFISTKIFKLLEPRPWKYVKGIHIHMYRRYKFLLLVVFLLEDLYVIICSRLYYCSKLWTACHSLQENYTFSLHWFQVWPYDLLCPMKCEQKWYVSVQKWVNIADLRWLGLERPTFKAGPWLVLGSLVSGMFPSFSGKTSSLYPNCLHKQCG